MSLSTFSILPRYFSDSSTSFLLLFHMTTWPSGLRRVTRNHFSSGGVGSNPAVVVFCRLFCFLNTIIVQKMVPPRFELGSREPESHMLPLHHGTFSSYKSCLPFTIVNYSFQYSVPPLYIPPTLSSII